MNSPKPTDNNGKRPHHPAELMFILTFVLLLLTVLLGFIAVFVPWAMKEMSVGQRAWAYPFKTCIEQTYSPIHEQTCIDNDFIEPPGAPLTGGNDTCKAFILSTIAFVFISVILGVVILLVLAWVLFSLWSRPMRMAMLAQVGLIIVCIAAILAWIMFICYAEKECAPNSIFPVHGYSYGFILYIFASVLAIMAVITGFMGLSKLKGYQPIPQDEYDASCELPEVAGGNGAFQYPVYSDANTGYMNNNPAPSFNDNNNNYVYV